MIAVYLAHQLLMALAGYCAVVFFPGRYDPARAAEIVTRGLNRWDAGWYLAIAKEGYTGKTAAFFPFYPLLIHLLSRLGVTPETAGALVANGALLGALAVFYRLARLDHSRREAERALWYLAFFPTAFFLSVIYTESLFLLLVLLSFYLARRHHWLPAAVTGMLAAATRNTGVFLFLPLAWEYLRATGGKIKRDGVSLGLIPLGLLIFMFYLKQHLGDPLAFIHAQQYWHRGFGWPWASIWRALVLMRADYHFSRQLLDLTFTLAGFGLFCLSLTRERASYSIFVFTGLFLPLFSPAPHAPLYSMPRFVLVLFPLYLTMARRFRGEGAHNFILALSAALFFFLYVIFARGHWVA
ncbi:mannosyltransferase family protein [Desulfotomaculum copahuensis]|uniref:mannosyltransferase family protein n=1 Tax=Desulfotomaculum copahuensis TaxID=1838280 RepID=UPI001372D3C8|nr:mannosyltransferase family protein [Desulfotomaculum copahuensis]